MLESKRWENILDEMDDQDGLSKEQALRTREWERAGQPEGLGKKVPGRGQSNSWAWRQRKN